MTEHLEHLVFAYAYTEKVAPVKERYRDSREEGRYLASALIAKLPRSERSSLTPELLVLFAAEGSQERKRDLQEFLDGIWETLESKGLPSSLKLIGCSTAGCIADGKVHLEGTVLIALCSVSPVPAQASPAKDVQRQNATRQRGLKLIKAACGKNAADNPDGAAQALYNEFGLGEAESDFNPHDNRFAMMFLPGYKKVEGEDPKYEDSRVVRAFCEKTRYEIPVCGGSGAQAVGIRDVGHQFLGKHVFKNAVVAALIECDTQFGIAMNSTFRSMHPQRFIRIDIEGGNRRQVKYSTDRGTRRLIEKRRLEDKLLILGARNEEGDPTIYIPKLQQHESDRLTFWRDVDEHRDLELLGANPDELLETLTSTVQTARKRAALLDLKSSSSKDAEGRGMNDADHVEKRTSRMAGVIGFFCAGRLTYPGMKPNNWKRVLKETASMLEGRPLVGGFVNGECGLDRTGRCVHNNLQLSGLVLGTQLSLEAQIRWGYQALSKVSESMMEANCVKDAVAAAVDGLLDAGFRGGMLSLLCPEGDDLATPAAVVAQDACGGKWPEIINETKRMFGDSNLDILAFAYQEAKSQYVRDARAPGSRCEPSSRDKVGVRSMFVGLLKNSENRPFGVLQIDLGDRTLDPQNPLTSDPTGCGFQDYNNLPDRLLEFLSSYVSVVASALQRAMTSEQEQAHREITEAFYRAIDHRDTPRAANEIILKILAVLGLDLGYIRLRSDDEKHLVWCAGKGAYSDALSKPECVRHVISIDGSGSSSSAASFGYIAKSGSFDVKGIVGNDVTKSPRSIRLREELNKEPLKYAVELEALSEVKSFVNLAFSSDTKGRPLGALNIDSKEPWFFTQNRIDIIRKAASRMGLCLRASRTQEVLINLSNMHGFASTQIAAASSSPLKEKLPRALIEGARRVCTELRSAELWTYHHGDQRLNRVRIGDAIEAHADVAGSGAFGEVLKGIKATWISASDDSLPPYFRNKMRSESLSGCVVLPLRAGDEQGRFGGSLFCFCGDRPKPLVEENLSLYAASAAYALHNWQLVQAGRELAECQDFSSVQSVLESHAAVLTGATAGCVWVYQRKIERYQLGPLWGYPRFTMECIRPRRSGDTFKLKEGNEPFMYIQVDSKGKTRPELLKHQPGIKSWVGVRLAHGDSFVGVIYLDFPSETNWAQRSELFFLGYAGYLGATLDRLSRDEALRNTELLVRRRIFSDVALYSTLSYVDALDVWQSNLQDQLVTLGSSDVSAREMAVSQANTIVEGIRESVEKIKGQMPGGDDRTATYAPESFDLETMIRQKWEDAVKLRPFPLNRHGKTIEYERKKSITDYCRITLNWPRNLFAQVLNFIIINALDAMDDFLLRDEGKKDDMDITFTIERQGDNDVDAWVHMWNKHPTFEESAVNEIHFGKGSLMKRGQGRGFQLVRAILSQAGGSIIVSNVTPPEEGCGSTVRLRIPIECPQNAFPQE